MLRKVAKCPFSPRQSPSSSGFACLPLDMSARVGGGSGGVGLKRLCGCSKDPWDLLLRLSPALGGPGQAQAERLSCGCEDRCGACVGAEFLDALPSRDAPEFRGFVCTSCEKQVEHYTVGARTVQLGHVWWEGNSTQQ